MRKHLARAALLWIASAGVAFAAVDINSASIEELDGLKGIGHAKAKAIVEDRQKNGPFKSVDDLARVPGIGEKLIERFRADVTVGGAKAADKEKTAKK